MKPKPCAVRCATLFLAASLRARASASAADTAPRPAAASASRFRCAGDPRTLRKHLLQQVVLQKLQKAILEPLWRLHGLSTRTEENTWTCFVLPPDSFGFGTRLSIAPTDLDSLCCSGELGRRGDVREPLCRPDAPDGRTRVSPDVHVRVLWKDQRVLWKD